MFIIHLMFTLVFLYIIITTLYLVILTVAAYCFTKKQGSIPGPFSIALIIPAHNEALEIGKTIENVKGCGYPEDAYGIVVIADNCNDETASLARSAGAVVVERTDMANRGKGQALDWFFKNHADIYGRYDAVAIMDADTLMHGFSL